MPEIERKRTQAFEPHAPPHMSYTIHYTLYTVHCTLYTIQYTCTILLHFKKMNVRFTFSISKRHLLRGGQTIAIGTKAFKKPDIGHLVFGISRHW